MKNKLSEYWRQPWIILFFCFTFAVCIGVICLLYRIMYYPEAPGSFPDAEIVFQAVNNPNYNLGYINADGTDLTYLNLYIRQKFLEGGLWGGEPVQYPIMTGDNSVLIIRLTNFPTYPGELAIIHAGDYPMICKDWGWRQFGRPQLTIDQSHLLVQTEVGLALYDLDSCNKNSTPDQIYEFSEYSILSPDKLYIADDRGYQIVIQNIETGENKYIQDGGNPAWSRDSQWLSFIGSDGIYVVRRDGSEKHKLVDLEYLFDPNRPAYAGDQLYFAPWASWSPDGKWLVYHRCLDTRTSDNGCTWENQAIFKVSIDAGEEIKLVDNGIYPYWRWP